MQIRLQLQRPDFLLDVDLRLPARGASEQPPLDIEPETVQAEKAIPLDAVIRLLMVQMPPLACVILDRAAVPGAK